MYDSKKKDDGTYSLKNYISRGLELVEPKILNNYINKYLPGTGFFRKTSLFFDYYFCLARYGAIVPDYFEYQFWKKRACERKKYITMKMNKQIKKAFNHEKTGVFRNKMLFNEKFAKYRNLHTFDFEKGTVEEFLEFVEKCNRNIIAKPLTGYSGHGIEKPDVSTDELAKKAYEELKATNDFFCEEAFVQDGVLHEINPTSVNTVRVYTIFDGEKVHVTATNVRFGGGMACVDNIHSGGMCCEVDEKTGYVIGAGFNLSGDKYIYHPATNKMIPGIKIPNWEEVMRSVTEAAAMFKDQGYVAWDIAVSESKVSIIEGNDGGNFDLPQVCSERGMKEVYAGLLKARQNRK